MPLLPLTLGVRPSSGAEVVSAPKQKSLAEKALKRDDHTCRFCGFHSEKFQRTVPYEELDPPVATACVFCEQVLNLERAAMTGAGLLIWLPEVNQADLNHMARAIYVARAANDDGEKGSMAALATRALDALTLRRSEAKKRLGTDDPLLLATILRESLNKQELKAAAGKLEGIRLLPSEKYMARGAKGDTNQFPTLAKYWATEPYKAWPVATWAETLKKALAATGKA